MKAKNVKRKNPEALKNLYDRMVKCTKNEVACGYPKGKVQAYPTGESVAEVAAKQCYGLGVPVRDFMSLGKQFIDADQKIKDIYTEIAKETAKEDWSPKVVEALQDALGLRAQALIQQAIDEGNWEPNSDYTKAKKGSDQPLVDTSHMLNSTTFVVRGKTT